MPKQNNGTKSYHRLNEIANITQYGRLIIMPIFGIILLTKMF